jgi:hypothetical protein
MDLIERQVNSFRDNAHSKIICWLVIEMKKQSALPTQGLRKADQQFWVTN